MFHVYSVQLKYMFVSIALMRRPHIDCRDMCMYVLRVAHMHLSFGRSSSQSIDYRKQV